MIQKGVEYLDPANRQHRRKPTVEHYLFEYARARKVPERNAKRRTKHMTILAEVWKCELPTWHQFPSS